MAVYTSSSFYNRYGYYTNISGTDQADQFYLQDYPLSGANLDIVVSSGGGDDYIRSGRGNDFLYGGDGADAIYGGYGQDVIYGGAGDDLLYGALDNGAGGRVIDNAPDTVYGGDGNDRIFYDFTGDTIYGGTGNDYYIYSAQSTGSTTDTIVENLGEGVDTIEVGRGNVALNFFSTPANVENIILVNQIITQGNASDNTIAGSQYNDEIYGLDGNDLINGAGGNDLIYGGNGNDSIFGEADNDVIIGGAGIDTMAGGPGNDLYGVDDPNDYVVEQPGEGYDEVYSSVNYTLTNNTETLFLTGTAQYGYGNSGNNGLIGNDADNILDAGAGSFEVINGNGGNDLLIGGPGHDEIRGGPGNDLFRFTSPADAFNGASNDGDLLLDFTPGQDRIQLNAAAFGIGTAANPVADGTSFINGPSPTTAAPTLLYTQGNGLLFYDADGVGAQNPTVLAALSGTPALQASDFTVY